MGLFKRIIDMLTGGETKEITVPRYGVRIEQHVVNRDDFQLDVVGESYYQENLWRIRGPGRRPKDGVDMFETAELVPDDANPHDENAVRVEIEGMQVGHLSRVDAKRYRQKHGRSRNKCTAWVRGGFIQDDGRRAHLGVRLDLVL